VQSPVVFLHFPLDTSYCCDIILISSLEVLFMEEKIITGHKNGMLVLLLGSRQDLCAKLFAGSG